jgi:multisubunit Na+/H+ antiporter MnhB subunit
MLNFFLIVKKNSIKFKSQLLFFWLILYANSAFAYLDPGTGSALLQGLIGGIAVGMSFLSIYWQKVRTFLTNIKKKLTYKN